MPDAAVVDEPVNVNDNLAMQIDRLADQRRHKKEFEDRIKEIKTVIDGMEAALLAALDELGIAGARGRAGSISVSESVVPQVEDWDTFYAFIRRHNKFELLERRASAGAFRELAALRRDHSVPGCVPFTKRTLSFRTNT